MSKKSGLADSPFFAPAPGPAEEAREPETSYQETDNALPSTPSIAPELVLSPEKPSDKQAADTRQRAARVRSVEKDTAAPSIQSTINASNNASMHALLQDGMIETIRKAVKDVGKDSATYRFTPEEKKALLELGFSFKMQGYKTSENELVRIAINFILEDQRLSGRESVLQKVLEALNK